MKIYRIECCYRTQKIEDPRIDFFSAYIYDNDLLSFSNYRFMHFKRKINENDFDFIKRNFKTLLIKSKYKFIDDIRIYQK